MSSIFEPTIDYFLRTRRQNIKSNDVQSIRRTILPIQRQITVQIQSGKSFAARDSRILKSPISDDRSMLNMKARLYLRSRASRLGSPINRISDDGVNVKRVGLFGSNSRLGRAAQAAGSMLLPGNISPIRSPIRSGLYQALTPGGGGGRGGFRPMARNGVHRCPAGFEYGGRYTDSRFSTCGAQLFEIPGLGAITRAIRNVVAPGARAESLAQVLEGQPTGDRTVQIQRLAQIPRKAAPNREAFNKAVFDSIETLKAAPAGEGRLVRRDGIVLRPIVPSSVLRQFSGNDDMSDGAMIRAVQTPKDISKDDVALLAGPSMQRISFIAPNGVTINIQRERPLTVGERRKFGRQLNRAIADSDPYDVGANIKNFAEGTDGAFKYTETYAGIPEPLEFVEYEGPDGVTRRVRRWVYETFIKKNLPAMRERRNRREARSEQRNQARGQARNAQ